MPRLTKLLYAATISYNDTSLVPRANEGTGSNLVVMPNLWANSTTLGDLTSSISWALKVFLDRAIPFRRVNFSPEPSSPSEFRGLQTRPSGSSMVGERSYNVWHGE